jgi:hypothetical protein
MTTTIELPPAKRIVCKSFDGTAHYRAQLAKRVQSREIGRQVEVVAGLLDYGYPQAEVQSIVGVPQKVVSSIARDIELPIHRAGRRPSDMGKIFANPARHLRMSIFLQMIEELVPDLRKGGKVTGEALLSASKHVDAVCGGMGDDEMGVRYCVPAIHQLAEGHLFLKTCGCCQVRSLRSRKTLKVNGSAMIGGECPYCMYRNGLAAKARKRMHETRGIAPAFEAPQASFDDAEFGPSQTAESSDAALRSLLSA